MTSSVAAAAALVRRLVSLGLTDLVLCPGSRSAPLAYVAGALDEAGELRLHVRVDERSAGFLALGLGMASGRPAALVTTSGTAVANLHPAVVEASHAQVPLLVLSADRPGWLRDTGANQTIDQVGIFGSAVRWHADLPSAGSEVEVAPLWASAAERGWRAALQVPPGPVQLNLPLGEPLAVSTHDLAEVMALEAPPVEPEADSESKSESESESAQRSQSPALRVSARTLVVLGHLPSAHHTRQAREWAHERGWPVVAEPLGDLGPDPVLAHGLALLQTTQWVLSNRPQTLLVLGRPTLSRAVAQLALERRMHVIAIAPPGLVTDPVRTVSQRYDWSVLGQACGDPVDQDWAMTWRRAAESITRGRHQMDLQWNSGPALAHSVLEIAGGRGDALVWGASSVVRDAAEALPAVVPTTAYSNRGAAGIDGTVSTAMGIALAHGPTTALLGDLTLIHDSNGLALGPREPRPDLSLVVLNDNGGAIFAQLEQGEPGRPGDFERLFATPLGTDLSALCSAHGIPHQRVTRADQLRSALEAAPQGIRVIEVPAQRADRRELRARLASAAASALGSGPPASD